jgi:hypothetical protein
MWHRVEVVLTDVSEERIASIFSLLLTSLTDASREDFLIFPSTLKIPEDCFLHSHRRENLKSYRDSFTYLLGS